MNYVSYLRVSTQKQGDSGLGLEAQRSQIALSMKGNTQLREFVEVESGKRDDRPELMRALDYCKIHNAKLVIAKLDRLSRKASFIFTLNDSGVDFQALDIPELNTLTLGVMATFAQHERERISQRIKDALQAKKDRGEQMGTPENLTDEARAKAWQATKQKGLSNKNNRRAFSYIKELRRTGLSWNQIAHKLNQNGFVTSKNKQFYAASVQGLFNRFQEASCSGTL